MYGIRRRFVATAAASAMGPPMLYTHFDNRTKNGDGVGEMRVARWPAHEAQITIAYIII